MSVTITKPALNLREALKRGVSMYGLQIATALQGGALNDVSIGGRTPAAGAFTSLEAGGALYVDEVNGRVGIGTDGPATTLDILGPNAAQLRVSNTDVNLSNKNFYLQGRHRTNAEPDITIFRAESDATNNTLSFGGGSSLLNSATILRFLTGGDNTTLTGTERMQINAGGSLLVGTTAAGSAGAGDIVVNGGIFLGGSAAANELNDYEEGTWTPVLSDGTNADATYTVQVGSYTKVGNKVHVQGRITTSALGTISGNLRVTGLPFASRNISNDSASLNFGYATGLSITAGQNLAGQINPNTSYVELDLWDATSGVSYLQDTEFTADGNIIFSAEYIAA